MLPLHRLNVLKRHQVPFAVGSFDAIGPLSRADFPHRHRFYEIVYVTGGTGTHVIDLAEYPLRPPQLWVVVPGQVHYWKQVTGLQGSVIVFDEEFLLSFPTDRESLELLSRRPWSHVEDSDRELSMLIAEMEREYRDGATGVSTVLQSYLHILLVRALRAPGVEPVVARAPGRRAEVAQQFWRTITGLRQQPQPVGAYAAQLGVSVAYLNETVRQVTGRTPAQLIRQMQALEAKRLLVQTEMSVVQIARELGFADPAYFCRFFRREAGISAGEFRQHWENHHDHLIVSIDSSRCSS